MTTATPPLLGMGGGEEGVAAVLVVVGEGGGQRSKARSEWGQVFVRRTYFGQSDELHFVINWLIKRCKLRPEHVFVATKIILVAAPANDRKGGKDDQGGVHLLTACPRPARRWSSWCQWAQLRGRQNGRKEGREGGRKRVRDDQGGEDLLTACPRPAGRVSSWCR